MRSARSAEHHQTSDRTRPDWTFGFPAPRKFSPLWMLEGLAMLGVPLAAMGIVAMAHTVGVIKLY